MIPDRRLLSLPKSTSSSLMELLNIGPLKSDSVVEIKIRLQKESINIRHLASFLRLLDRSYGRLTYGDLKSYAWKAQAQLTASDIRRGSWEMVLCHAMSIVPSAAPIIVVYLLLKLMPSALEKLATSYNNLEQARLARANRKLLRSRMGNDVQLNNLTVKQQNTIAAVLDSLVRLDPRVGREAQEFASKHIISIEVSVKTPDG
jgi:hypothetical protein